jgi:hypothetical protein
MRKIHLVKTMLRNEKRASQLISNEIGSLTKDILMKDVSNQQKTHHEQTAFSIAK